MWAEQLGMRQGSERARNVAGRGVVVAIGVPQVEHRHPCLDARTRRQLGRGSKNFLSSTQRPRRPVPHASKIMSPP